MNTLSSKEIWKPVSEKFKAYPYSYPYPYP